MMKRQKFYPSISWPTLLIWIVMQIILFGCQANNMVPEETIIPFETIEKAQLSGTGEEYADEAKIVAITHLDEIGEVGNFISFSAQQNLQKLDYSQSIAIVVFQGKLRGFSIEIQQVIQAKNEIIVYAQVSSPLELFVGDIVISPYHVITILRTFLQGETKFVLNLILLPETP